MRRKAYISVVLALVGLLCIHLTSILMRHYFRHAHDADLMRINLERAGVFREIAMACEEYHAKHGRYPASIIELETAMGRPFSAIQLRNAIDPELRPNFAALNSPDFAIFIDDPGINWRWEPAIGGKTPPKLEQFRMVLTNELQPIDRPSAMQHLESVRRSSSEELNSDSRSETP